MKKIFVFLLGIINFSAFAQDVEPIQTDRPDRTESPSITPKRQAQFEAGFLFEENKPQDKNFVCPELLIKYGLSDHLELRLITSYNHEEIYTAQGSLSTNSVAPLLIGLKTNFWDEKNYRPKTSMIFHVGIPEIASEVYKNNDVFTTFRFLMQHTLSETFNLSYNIGAEWDGTTTAATGIYTLSLGASLSSKIGGFIEVFGYYPQHQKSSHNADMGFTYLIHSDVQLDASGGFGITDNAPKYFIGIGISCRTGH